MSEKAPFYSDLSDVDDRGSAYWLKTSDNKRIRTAVWKTETARGTVFILPGRTEYCEKYAYVAGDLLDHNLSCIAIDWRGQGLADHFGRTQMVGHVENFQDFQHDLRAVIDFAQSQSLPKPWYMLAHSMGGAIGLRALMTDHEFTAAAFSGPMWDIYLNPLLSLIAPPLSRLISATRLADTFAISTSQGSILLENEFQDNTLTTSEYAWNVMKAHMISRAELQLGGPSYRWLSQALTECRILSHMPSPQIPCLCLMGDNERIVCTHAVHKRMKNWPNGTLDIVSPGEHEVLMDTPKTVSVRVSQIATHFKNAG